MRFAVSTDDVVVTELGTGVSGNLLENDTDQNPADSLSLVDPVTGASASGPVTITTTGGGTVVINPDGSYVYTPAAGFAGVDTFDYSIIDSFGKTDTAGVEIEVRGAGEWSVAAPAEINEGASAQITVSLSGHYGAGEQVSVELGLTDEGSNSGDYADFVAAVETAIAGNPDFSFDPATGTLTYTSPADSSTMPDLVIELAVVEDGLIESAEAFTIGLNNATSASGGDVSIDPAGASVSTEIIDTDAAGVWSVTGPADVDEGVNANFTVSLSGEYNAGEVVTVDLGFTGSTTDSDHSDVIAAIQAAVTGNPDVSFDPVIGTLTYTAPTDGSSMSDIVIDVDITDDNLIEGPEEMTFALSNASNPTGSTIEVNADISGFTATVNDSNGDPDAPVDSVDGPGLWSIAGTDVTEEGGASEYTVSLSGEYGAGEVVSVDITLRDIDTNSGDYTSFIAALQQAVDRNSDVTFVASDNSQSMITRVISALLLSDATSGNTGTLTYTAPADGATMSDLVFKLPIVDDSMVEGAEAFAIDLLEATSSSSAAIAIGNATVITIINDNDVEEEPEFGAALSPIALYEPEVNRDFAVLSNGFERDIYSTSAGVDLIILEAINDLSSLNSSTEISAHDLHIRPLAETVNGSVGFSSGKGYRGTHGVDPTDECGRLYIDTIVEDEVLSVIARSTIDPERSIGVVGFSATLANGAPLPEWISLMSDGEYVIDRSVGIEVVVLKVTAHRADGSSLIRLVEIDTLTGEIRELEGAGGFGTSFYEELRVDASSFQSTAETTDQ